jgi:hypothetical protein
MLGGEAGSMSRFILPDQEQIYFPSFGRAALQIFNFLAKHI